MFTRRSFLKIAGVTSIAMSTGLMAKTGVSDPPYADNLAADEWIKKWMKSLGSVSEPLHLGRFSDRMYFLRKAIGWKPNPGQDLPEINVPVGFVTDFASIPRVFWSLLPPDGQYTYPAIIHDYLYWDQSISRDKADMILRYAMEDFKVNSVTIETIYAGVRAGGGFAWDGNASLKQSGENRILKIFPEDPTIRWLDWKRRNDVF
jgi:Protein of unknown function (DUF1353)